MKRDERIGCGIVFLFGAVTAGLSLRMPMGTFRMAGSGLFPFCLGILLMLLSLLFLFHLLYAKSTTPQKPETVAPPDVATGQMLLFLGATVLGTLCLNLLGYPLTVFLLMLMLLRILGIKRPGLLMIMPLLTAVVSYFLFVRILKIPLPKGLIGL
ncbi:MAG: tripartite tricarboxylate transporter TctB family protein [Syntrophales bacterium]|nr:tripartite tricarboxylate transporter TctB family protein [Syntrophales bacterium]